MKRTAILGMMLLLAAALSGAGPCDPRELSDSIDPLGSFMDRCVEDGQTGVSISGAIAYHLGKAVDPASINTSTVILRPAGGAPIAGMEGGFDYIACDADPLIGCPLGVWINPGGGNPCDLDPDTQYELVLDGLVLASGDTLDTVIITFTTGPVPQGYTPNFCSDINYINFQVTDNELDDPGISGDLAGELHPLNIVAVGVETGLPFQDYRNVVNPRYIALLEITNVFPDYDLNGLADKWVNLRIDGQDLKVHLPDIIIPAFETLVLYIADDGSTYYAIDGLTYNMDDQDCDEAGGGCPSYTPDQAYVPGRLAAGASGDPSITPQLIERDSLDLTEGLNGGAVNETPGTITYKIFAIQSDPPYYGWDQLNNATDFQVGFKPGVNPYTTASPMYLRLCPFIIAHHENGAYIPYPPPPHPDTPYPHLHPGITTPNSWLMIYIENKGAADFSLAGGRTVTISDGGADTIVPLPADTIPAGESLPLYVGVDPDDPAGNAASFYAYDDGGVRTLDLWAHRCDGGLTCPLLDPVSALSTAPAAQ